MSKISYVIGQAYSVAVSAMHWFASANASRDVQPLLEAAKQPKSGAVKGGVYESLVERGWATELPAQGLLLPYVDRSDDGKTLHTYTADEAVAERKATLAALDKAGNTDLANLLRKVWCTPDGGFVQPTMMGNSGFTRGLSLPHVLLSRQQIADRDGVQCEDFRIQVVVKQFATKSARLREQAFENMSRKMSGVSDMGWPDILKAGQELIDAAGERANERMFREAFLAGTGIKAWAILTANNKHKELNLVERIKMPRPAGFVRSPQWYSPTGYIPAASIPQSALELRDAPDAETAEAWIEEKVFGVGKNAPKVLGKDTWKNFYTTLKVEKGSPLSAIIDCHLEGGRMAAVLKQWPQLAKANCVLSLAADDEAPEAKGPTKEKAQVAKAHKGK